MSSPPPRPSATAESPLARPDALIGTLGADRALALAYVPSDRRSAITALWELDAAMAQLIRSTSEPMIGQIRLAWWRERLQDLDRGLVPAEPRLQAAATTLLPRGISGATLSGLEDGWEALLEPFPWTDAVADRVAARGRLLFGLAATVLTGHPLASGGDHWALVDAARHCSDAASRETLLAHARATAAADRSPPALRPLTMLAALALRDIARGQPFEPEGRPARMIAMLRHWVTGHLPRAR